MLRAGVLCTGLVARLTVLGLLVASMVIRSKAHLMRPPPLGFMVLIAVILVGFRALGGFIHLRHSQPPPKGNTMGCTLLTELIITAMTIVPMVFATITYIDESKPSPYKDKYKYYYTDDGDSVPSLKLIRDLLIAAAAIQIMIFLADIALVAGVFKMREVIYIGKEPYIASLATYMRSSAPPEQTTGIPQQQQQQQQQQRQQTTTQVVRPPPAPDNNLRRYM